MEEVIGSIPIRSTNKPYTHNGIKQVMRPCPAPVVIWLILARRFLVSPSLLRIRIAVTCFDRQLTSRRMGRKWPVSRSSEPAELAGTLTYLLKRPLWGNKLIGSSKRRVRELMVYLDLVSIERQRSTRWKRLAISLLCVFLASMLCSLALAAQSGFALKAFLQNVFYFGSVTFFCSLPGWFIAIPVVLFVSNFSGWRFWAMLALGAGIGPFVMLAIEVYFQVTSPNPSHYAPEARNLVFLATAVSALTTAFYLVVVRRWLKASPV
jgi:hypothetical protein